jgi:hypothetical protein
MHDGFAAFTAAGLKQAPLDTAVTRVIDRVDLLSDPPARVSEALAAAGGMAPPKQQHKQKAP